MLSEPFTFSSITLKSPRLTLREFAEGDAEAIQVYAGDPEVTRFTSWGPNTPETTDAVLSGWLQEQKTSPRTECTLAIVRKEDGVLIGGSRLRHDRLEYRDGELRLCAPEIRVGSGLCHRSGPCGKRLGFG